MMKQQYVLGRQTRFIGIVINTKRFPRLVMRHLSDKAERYRITEWGKRLVFITLTKQRGCRQKNCCYQMFQPRTFTNKRKDYFSLKQFQILQKFCFVI